MAFPRARIAGMRPYRGGCELDLACAACGASYAVRQDTIGGLAFGRHACPACGAICELLPDEFSAAVQQAFATDLAAAAREADLATALAESWHRCPAFRELLAYEGVDLGPPTERELVGCISHILNALPREGGR